MVNHAIARKMAGAMKALFRWAARESRRMSR
jgi:hypothetical protein